MIDVHRESRLTLLIYINNESAVRLYWLSAKLWLISRSATVSIPVWLIYLEDQLKAGMSHIMPPSWRGDRLQEAQAEECV